MTKDTFEVRVLVKNRAIPKYFHQEQTYICGFENTEFELELVNNSDNIVLMIPSVDGLSVTDGKEASEDSQGYLVRPKSTVKVPGWTLDQDSVAKFVFAEKKKSYSAEHPDTPSTTNVGVIGCLVYSRKVTEGEKIDELLERIKELEKVKPIVVNPIYPWYWHHTYLPNYGSPYYNNNQIYCGGAGIGSSDLNYTPTIGMVTAGGLSGSINCSASYNATATADAASIMQNSTLCSNNIATNASSTLDTPAQENFELGTGFGEQTAFKTNNVTFDRDVLLETLVIFYDSKKNLERIGIVITPPKKEEKAVPNPFPKFKGCVPPKNWAEKA